MWRKLYLKLKMNKSVVTKTQNSGLMVRNNCPDARRTVCLSSVDRSGQAAGSYDTSAEALKVDIDTSAKMLYPLIVKIWEKNEVPADWKNPQLIKLRKKDISVCVHPW